LLLKSSFVKRSLAISILLLAFFLAGCWKEPGKLNWKNAPGAEQYERLMWQAIREKDWNEMEHHVASTFVGVSAGGQKLDRPGWMAYWKGLQIKDFSLGDLTVQANGPDMVIAYDLHLIAAAGTPVSDAGLRMVSVWQQVKSGWILISQSGTPIR